MYVTTLCEIYIHFVRKGLEKPTLELPMWENTSKISSWFEIFRPATFEQEQLMNIAFVDNLKGGQSYWHISQFSEVPFWNLKIRESAVTILVAKTICDEEVCTLIG